MKKLEIKRLSEFKNKDNYCMTYSVSVGYEKYFIYLENCDVVNSLIFFAVTMFDEFEVDFSCDRFFWKDYISLYEKELGKKKNIIFTGEHQSYIPFRNKSKHLTSLFFSGGLDSTLSLYLLEDVKEKVCLQFMSQAYPTNYIEGNKKVSTNIDDIIFHRFKGTRAQKMHKLEIMLPIINPYKERRLILGIEKDIWENGKELLDIDLRAWFDLFEKHGSIVSSVLKDKSVLEVVMALDKLVKQDIIKKENIIFCGNLDHDTFCYECEKCLMLFIYGAGGLLGYDESKFVLVMADIGVTSIRDVIIKTWGKYGKHPSENRHSFFIKLLNRIQKENE